LLQPTFCAQYDVSFELPGRNGRDSGIAGWEDMGMGFKFQVGMEMGIKSLKWEGIGMKNLFPHNSSLRQKFRTYRDPNTCSLHVQPTCTG